MLITPEAVTGGIEMDFDFRICPMERLYALDRNARILMSSQLTVSIVVHCHNLPGRAYLLAIAPFHRRTMKASLRRRA